MMNYFDLIQNLKLRQTSNKLTIFYLIKILLFLIHDHFFYFLKSYTIF